MIIRSATKYILILFISLPFSGLSQTAFYDALKLAEQARVINGKIIVAGNETNFDILANYLKPDSSSRDQVILEFQNNPFFSAAGGEMAAGSKFSGGGFLGGIGNLNVTNFADGLAKFLVERSKEELNVAFFRKFKEYMNSYPELDILFPTTTLFLENVAEYKYAAMLPALRSGFQKDFNAFSDHIISLRDLTSAANCPPGDQTCINRINHLNNFLNNTVAGRSIVAALLISDDVLKGSNAAEVIDNLANDRICQEMDENFSNVVQFVNMLSQSFRSKNEGEVWVTKGEFNDLLRNQVALKIYFGLIYQLDKKLFPLKFTLNATPQSFQSILTSLATKWDSVNTEVRSNLSQVGRLISAVTELTSNIRTLESGSASGGLEMYANYAQTFSELLKVSFNLLSNLNVIDTSLSQLRNDVIKFTTIVDHCVDACYDIKAQHYSSLVLRVLLVLDEIYGNKQYAYRSSLLKYGTFMASIVEADNSEDVKNAIEAAVLPVGSSSIKRETDFNIAINSYIGPFGGMEYLPALKQDQTAFVVGVTAPVGVAFSWGNKRSRQINKKGNPVGGKSISLFVPLIDVGALATFRFSDDSSNVASEVLLKNIVSPGLYLYYGLGKCPISIGVGGQLGPQLRKINATDINVDKNYYFRFGLNVVVDIPLFNIYTKSGD